jgi:FkbM family methyltransferase
MDELVVVDVGASGGLHRRWRDFTSHLTPILFEPDERAYRELQARLGPRTHVVNAGLFEEPGPQTFYLCRRQEVSSVFKPNLDLVNLYPHAERFEILDTIQVPMNSLDRVFEDGILPKPHFIKLDAEGSDLGILRGGRSVLTQVVGIEIEVQFEPVRREAPLFPEVDSFIKSEGFKLYDLANYYWKREITGLHDDSSLGELIVGEALYFRSTESILEMVSNKVFSVDQAIFSYLAYGYTHLAGVLVTLAAAQGLIDDQSRTRSLKYIDGFRRTKALSRFPLADTIRWRAIHLADRLLPSSNWAFKSKADVGSRFGTR